jgi:hypothetical protein
MTQEEKQLVYREERAEAAMFHICRDLYEIDVPNHPVKDGYRIGFNEGVEYAKKILIKKTCKWLEDIDFASEYFYDGEDFFKNAILIEEFKKAMEE